VRRIVLYCTEYLDLKTTSTLGGFLKNLQIIYIGANRYRLKTLRPPIIELWLQQTRSETDSVWER
jgi:hypothetical protein